MGSHRDVRAWRRMHGITSRCACMGEDAWDDIITCLHEGDAWDHLAMCMRGGGCLG